MYDKMGMKRVFASGAILMILSGLGFWYACAGDSLRYDRIFLIPFSNISTGLLDDAPCDMGDGRITKKTRLHGTALLTSLRTVSGSFRVAIFLDFGIRNVSIRYRQNRYASSILGWLCIGNSGTCIMYMCLSEKVGTGKLLFCIVITVTSKDGLRSEITVSISDMHSVYERSKTC